MKHLIFYLLSVIILISCQHNEIENKQLKTIDYLISHHPDSALNILNSLNINPNDAYNYYRYLLLLIKTKDEIERDLSKETEIIKIYDYFKEKEDELAGVAAYYCARVLQENKEYSKALQYYHIAESYSLTNKDKDFQGIILHAEGVLMLDQSLFNEAKIKLTKANLLFSQTGNYKHKIKNYNKLASTYLIKEEHDSALFYYDKVLAIASKQADNTAYAYALKDKGVVSLNKGDFGAATSYLFQAKRIDSALIKSGRADIVLAQVYLGLQKTDSARYYANSSLYWLKETKNQNPKTLATINLLLSQIEEHSKNYNKALDYHKYYSHNRTKVFSQDKAHAILDTERKHQLEVIQNEHTQLSLKHLRTQRVVFLLLLIITISAIIYYRKILKKNRLLSKANIKVSNLTGIIGELEKVKAEFDKARKVYKRSEEVAKNSVIHNFDILRRAALLEYFVQDSGNKQGEPLIKRFNEIAYGQATIDWDVLYEIINSIHDGLFDKIKNKYYDVLDEADFRICCLICSKLTSNEISIIMQLNINTVHMKTTHIRKKLGIKKYGSISDFLSDNVE